MKKSSASLTGPKFVRYFWPVIEALKKLGGSARPAEVREGIAVELRVSEAEQAETIKSGFSRFDNSAAWARFYLSKVEIIDASSRGVWTLAEKGRKLTSLSRQEALKIFKDVQVRFQADRNPDHVPGGDAAEDSPPQDAASSVAVNFRQQLLEILQGLPPSGFERFCRRLLRE